MERETTTNVKRNTYRGYGISVATSATGYGARANVYADATNPNPIATFSDESAANALHTALAYIDSLLD